MIRIALALLGASLLVGSLQATPILILDPGTTTPPPGSSVPPPPVPSVPTPSAPVPDTSAPPATPPQPTPPAPTVPTVSDQQGTGTGSEASSSAPGYGSTTSSIAGDTTSQPDPGLTILSSAPESVVQYTANPPAPEITVPSYQEQVSDVPAVPSQVKITASGALIALPAAAAATPVPEPVSVLGAGVLATTAAWCVRRRRPA